MSTLLSSMNRTARTENGAVQHNTTKSACLDFFQQAGALRKDQDKAGRPRPETVQATITRLWQLAYNQDKETAIRILQWAYDCRGGAGSRDVMSTILPRLVNRMDNYNNQEQLKKLIVAIPELGRWDMVMDLLEYDDLPTWLRSFIFRYIKLGLDSEETAALVAKWMPRDGKVCKRVRGWLKMKATPFRHMLTQYPTPEALMSQGLWAQIKYKNVPSVCMARSRKAFARHDKERFDAYIQSVLKGKAKIHAGVVMPYDIIRDGYNNADAAQAQWNALPNFMEGYKGNILPLVDVSDSMGAPVSGSISAMDVSVALGIYVAQHNTGGFKDELCVFSREPVMMKLTGNLMQDVYAMKHVTQNHITDIARCVETILKAAKNNHLSEEDMPTALLILSDMQFDAMKGKSTVGTGYTCLEYIQYLYQKYGHKMPVVIYWNLCGVDAGGAPATVDDQGVVLVGGFSAAIAKTLLAGQDLTKVVDPVEVMLKTVYDDRYDLNRYDTKEVENVWSEEK